MTARTSTRRRSLERGGASWVTVLLVAALATAGYLAWTYVPVYLMHLTVKQAARGYMNEAVKNLRDEELVQFMVQKIRSLEEVQEVQPDGTVGRVPAIDLHVEDVTWERDLSVKPPMLHVAFEYQRTVHYPLTERVGVMVFRFDQTQDLQIPNWGPAR